ncbi:lactate dehydrogenase-like 2-hydroxyacid dehydrogenase [Pseudomonas duriflava]|uniref:Lactate dehydrogenase-like 2-hydroxyacid dehydrogenase n=1 Tax=Pseudomonas duriflava TaxID=459528 RepID=A0A562Q794_9PSED|nr:2-hydroxyacid dehydrogenase [Pseudomonas duriflava]TWI52631.1 lactate dehydrogenase-like 2-hydroxyacid dehydrogenase [Pseudomonas duriflava]
MSDTSQSPTLLLIGPLFPSLQQRIESTYKTHRLWETDDPKHFLATHAEDINGIVTSGIHGCTGDIIRALPHLRVIVSFGVGYDAIDVATARDRNVLISNTPGVLDDCVADTAFALLIDVARSISASDRFVRSGRWLKEKFPLGRKLAGKTCGIVGLGNIGKAIAKRVTAFDMKVAYYGRHQQQDVPYRYEPDLKTLASQADFLVLAVPGGSATHHLIDADILQALGKDGYLINIARGSVVDEAALVDALQRGVIAGAGLDVFAHEPHVPQPLLEMDNVVLTPHLGSGTHETRQAMADLAFENLTLYFTNGQLKTPV